MVIYVESGTKDNLLYVIYAMFRVIKLRFVLIKISVGGVVSLVILHVVAPKTWIPLPSLGSLDPFLPSTSSGVGTDPPLDPNALSAERSNLVRVQNEAIDQKLPNVVVEEAQNDDVVQVSEGQNEGTETVESCESENNIVSESNEGTDSNAIITDVEVLGHEDRPGASGSADGSNASAEARSDSQDSLMEFSESLPSQSTLPAEGSTVSAETGDSQDSISEFSESSPSQSILGPKNGHSVGYGSRNLQGKVKSSVISKLLPRRRPVVRTGHHAFPAVVPNRPVSGVKTKKG